MCNIKPCTVNFQTKVVQSKRWLSISKPYTTGIWMQKKRFDPVSYPLLLGPEVKVV